MRQIQISAASAAAAVLLTACATTADTPPRETLKATPAAPSAPVYVVDDIMNASADAIDALLGPAALTRKEGDGEFRRYSLSECALIIILYPDETGKPRAAHLEATARSSGAEKPVLKDCLAAG